MTHTPPHFLQFLPTFAGKITFLLPSCLKIFIYPNKSRLETIARYFRYDRNYKWGKTMGKSCRAFFTSSVLVAFYVPNWLDQYRTCEFYVLSRSLCSLHNFWREHVHNFGLSSLLKQFILRHMDKRCSVIINIL